jgi:tight adherence protein C
MSWPVAFLVVLWMALTLTRAVERRPVRRIVLLQRTSFADARSAHGEERQRRRPAALWGRSGLIVLVAAVAIAALVLVGPVGAVLAAASVPVLARARARRTERARVSALQARLPDAVDLLVVAGTAGLAPRQALALVSERGPPELRPAFAEVVARAGAGEPWSRAVERLLATVGEPARGVVHAIVAAEQDGAPMGTMLSRLADDARRQRRHDLEAAVRRLPVRLSFPLVCCSLPAFVLLTVVPLIAAGLRRLGPVAL